MMSYSDYLIGSELDNWSFNDLETFVEVYKRQLPDEEKQLKYKIQEIELDVRIFKNQGCSEIVGISAALTVEFFTKFLGDLLIGSGK